MARGGLWPASRASRRDAGGCCGGDGTTAAVETGKWAREGRREARNMTALSAWKEEGLSSGDAARPSLAMAAMALGASGSARKEAARRVGGKHGAALARVEK